MEFFLYRSSVRHHAHFVHRPDAYILSKRHIWRADFCHNVYFYGMIFWRCNVEAQPNRPFHLESAAFLVHMRAKIVDDSAEAYPRESLGRCEPRVRKPTTGGLLARPFQPSQTDPKTRGCLDD